MKTVRLALLSIAFMLSGAVFGQTNLPACQGTDVARWSNCFGSWDDSNGDKYVGEWKDGKFNGQGTFSDECCYRYEGEFKDGKLDGYGTYDNDSATCEGEWKGGKLDGQGTCYGRDGGYVGEWKNDMRNGQGIQYYKGKILESGIFKDGELVSPQYVNPDIFSRIEKSKRVPDWVPERVMTEAERAEHEYLLSLFTLPREAKPSSEKQPSLDADNAQSQQPKLASRLSLQITTTKPDADGDFVINIQTSADTASLKIDDEEQGANKNGTYIIRRVARVGATNTITIRAKDIYGNTDTKTINVARQAVDSRPTFARLNPANIKPQPTRDAVAIIIGIQNYKLIPKAEYASQDAQDFYDYASRALGIKQENIKLLLDDEADVSGIFKALQSWLPLKVRKGKTDVYVFYSGHGLPSADGKSLYFLPVGADRDLIAKTAISQKEIVDALKSAQPKSVTMFIDSCYSGQIRTGETLLASARPVVLTVQETAYPPEFTVITASASDQIASSSPDLKHGIFSYYLMKGLEGEADDNKDGTITIGKLQSYLAERVPRFAMTMSRKQEPQLTGDANRVLVTR